MANLYSQNRSQKSFADKHNHPNPYQLPWQYVQNNNLYKNPNTTESDIVPQVQPPSICASNSTRLAADYAQHDAGFKNLQGDLTASQQVPNHHWGEPQLNHSELYPNLGLANPYSTTDNLPPLTDWEMEMFYNDLFPNFYNPPTSPLYQPFDPPSLPGMMDYQFDLPYLSPEPPGSFPSNASSTSNSTHICSMCPKTFTKRHLLKYVLSLFHFWNQLTKPNLVATWNSIPNPSHARSMAVPIEQPRPATWAVILRSNIRIISRPKGFGLCRVRCVPLRDVSMRQRDSKERIT
jgi:hypothetical protein